MTEEVTKEETTKTTQEIEVISDKNTISLNKSVIDATIAFIVGCGAIVGASAIGLPYLGTVVATFMGGMLLLINIPTIQKLVSESLGYIAFAAHKFETTDKVEDTAEIKTLIESALYVFTLAIILFSL